MNSDVSSVTVLLEHYLQRFAPQLAFDRTLYTVHHVSREAPESWAHINDAGGVLVPMHFVSCSLTLRKMSNGLLDKALQHVPIGIVSDVVGRPPDRLFVSWVGTASSRNWLKKQWSGRVKLFVELAVVDRQRVIFRFHALRTSQISAGAVVRATLR